MTWETFQIRTVRACTARCTTVRRICALGEGPEQKPNLFVGRHAFGIQGLAVKSRKQVSPYRPCSGDNSRVYSHNWTVGDTRCGTTGALFIGHALMTTASRSTWWHESQVTLPLSCLIT